MCDCGTHCIYCIHKESFSCLDDVNLYFHSCAYIYRTECEILFGNFPNSLDEEKTAWGINSAPEFLTSRSLLNRIGSFSKYAHTQTILWINSPPGNACG